MGLVIDYFIITAVKYNNNHFTQKKKKHSNHKDNNWLCTKKL